MTIDDMVPVQTIHHGWIVVLNTKVLVEGLRSNAEAWLWVDKNTDEGRAYTRTMFFFAYCLARLWRESSLAGAGCHCPICCSSGPTSAC